MFGENVIVVKRTLRIDAKNRIILPSETGATIHDSICFMHDIYCTKLVLYNEETFATKIEAMLTKLHDLYQSRTIDYKKYTSFKRYICGLLCYASASIDSARRLTLPPKAIQVLNLTTSLYAVGEKNTLVLYKDEEAYLHPKK